MARPRKIIINEEYIEMDVKNIQRVVSKSNRTFVSGEYQYYSGADVDTYLSGFEGYKLHTVLYLGELPEGYNMWYVLVKE